MREWLVELVDEFSGAVDLRAVVDCIDVGGGLVGGSEDGRFGVLTHFGVGTIPSERELMGCWVFNRLGMLDSTLSASQLVDD